MSTEYGHTKLKDGNNKERIQKKKKKKKALESYQNFSAEIKYQKCRYARARYVNLSEEEKKTKRVSIVENHVKIFLKMKNESYIGEIII